MRRIGIALMGLCATLIAGAAMVRAQSGIIISAPTCEDAWFAADNPRCSPEQRARGAERKRAQDAAEALRKTEQARKDATIASEVQKLGGHRIEEARRLVEMREAAARARPVAPTTSIKPDRKCEKVPAKGMINSMPEDASLLFTGFKTRPEAEASIKRKMEKGCLAGTGTAGGGLSNLSCMQEGGRWTCNAAYTCTGSGVRNCSGSQ